jgi:tetratricopeptide (TPR) repeat protein
MTKPGELRLKLEGQEQVFLLEAPTTTIGRGSRNSLALSDHSVSRYHAELIRLDRDYLLRDLGSANGSYVNGIRISEQLLNDGDVLRFGTSGLEIIFKLVPITGSVIDQTRHTQNTTDSLISVLSTKLDLSMADEREEVNLRCVLAEANLHKGQPEKALKVLSKYTQRESIPLLPIESRAKALYWLGRAYVEAKRYLLGCDTLLAVIDLYMQMSDDAGIAEARAALGQAMIGLGDWPVARDNLHRASFSARKAGNARLHVEVHLQLGRLDWKEGDFDGASYNWSRAARLSEDLNDPLLEARVQLQRAFILYSQGKLKEAVPAYEQAIEQIEKIGNIRFLLKAYSHLSRALTRLGSWTATERLLELRLRLSRENSIAKSEAVALTDLAELRFLQGKLNAAWNVIQTAVQRHSKTVYARTQRILGRILSAREDYRSAIEEYRKGLEVAKMKGALEEQILLGVELALAYLELGDKEQASEQLKAVESDPMLDPGLSLMARALYARGLVKAAFGQAVEAHRAFTQSLSIFQSIGDPYRMALCHTAIGTLRAGMGRAESARAHLEEAREIFARIGAAFELERTERELASVMYENVVPAMTRELPPGLSLTAPLSMALFSTGKLSQTLVEPKPHRILVAEADDQLASVLEKGLEAENYVVDRVLDGRVALERAVSPQFSYDLLVLDTLLEHRSGFDVCRDLRKAKLGVPLILLGSRQGSEDKIEALQAGADDFLCKKGMAFEELLAKMESILS